MVFIAQAPVGGPVAQLVMGAHIPGQKSLFVAEALADVMEMGAEIVQKAGQGADIEAVDRAVADHAPRFFPVADDPHFVVPALRLSEKAIDVVNDNDVDVQKQRPSAEAV